MRNINPEMLDSLSRVNTSIATCVKLTRTDGVIVGYTTHDRPLTFDGTTYDPDNGIIPTKFEEVLGADPDDMDLVGAFEDDQMKDDVISGKYDNAELIIYKVDWMRISDPRRRIIRHKGNLGTYTRRENRFTIQYRGITDKLNRKKGRSYDKLCPFRLFDGNCRVNRDAHSFTARVSNPQGKSTFLMNIDDPDGVLPERYQSLASRGLDGYFTQGTLIFTSGRNAGVKRDIKKGTQNVIELFEEAPFDVEHNDQVILRAGCRKTFETCARKFSNQERFGGFNAIPGDRAFVENASTCSADGDTEETPASRTERIEREGEGPGPEEQDSSIGNHESEGDLFTFLSDTWNAITTGRTVEQVRGERETIEAGTFTVGGVLTSLFDPDAPSGKFNKNSFSSSNQGRNTQSQNTRRNDIDSQRTNDEISNASRGRDIETGGGTIAPPGSRARSPTDFQYGGGDGGSGGGEGGS